MNEELYSYDKIGSYHIYTNEDNGKFYCDIYHNGTNIKNITGYSYNSAMDKCRQWIYKNE